MRLDPSQVRHQIDNLIMQFPMVAVEDIPYLQARFFSKVDLSGKAKNNCWVWSGSRDGDGYGMFRVDPITAIRAHRLSFIMFCGTLSDGDLVCHECDNPPCVNPAHFFRGTHQENIDDCIAKNRRANLRGSSHGRSKLTQDDVNQIRYLHATGIRQRELASQFSVSKYCIWSVVTYRTWCAKEIVHAS